LGFIGGVLTTLVCGGIITFLFLSASFDSAREPLGEDRTRVPAAPADRLFDRTALESKLSLATSQEVRRLLGEPAEVLQPAIGLPWADEREHKDLWVYHNKTRNPKTKKPDPELLVWFEHGHVSLVVCAPIHSMPGRAPETPPGVGR
jgi:hypothetical protein